jgi:hypothetical protein
LITLTLALSHKWERGFTTSIMGGYHVAYRHGFALTAWIQIPGLKMPDIDGTAVING